MDKLADTGDSIDVTVSVIVATRNRTDLLARALRSVARQTLNSIEVLVIDDGSDAEVLAHHDRLVSQLGERFHLHKPVVPGARGTGPSGARNRGIQLARGEFVAFVDDDDEWVCENYLELAVTSLRARGADYFFGHLEGVRDGVTCNPGWVPPAALFTQEKLTASPAVYELSRNAILTIAQRFMIHPSNSVIRRELIFRAGGFFEGLWSHAEDLNFMLRILDRARGVLYYAGKVANYRLPTGDSISLTEAEAAHFVQRILAAQQARLNCEKPEFRKCARAREAWTYREMASFALGLGQRSEATFFACQGLVTYPSLGALLFVLKICLGRLVSADSGMAKARARA
jgi:hypothetical protein